MIRTAIFIALPLTLGISACAHAPSSGAAAQQLVDARFQTFNRHDLDGIVKLYTADAVLSSPGFCTPRKGEDAVRRTYADLFKSYPGISDTVDSYMVQGNEIAVRFTTHVGKYALPIASFLTLRDGRIAREDSYFDNQGQRCN